MQNRPDAQLLRDYAENGEEGAFAEIVARHTSLVYSAALRQAGSPDVAAEVAHLVFIALAREARQLAARLAPDASLAGWLCRSARNISLNHRRGEFRRQSRERLAMQDLHTDSCAPNWENLSAVLDDAMADLDESDYDAIVMRFYKNQDLRSVGRSLGVSDDTAQKRVSRALDKLRANLNRHGVTTTAAALSLALSSQAVEAAPAGLAASILGAATGAPGALGASTAIAVTKGILMTTVQKALITAALAAALGTGLYQARRASILESQREALRVERDALAGQLQSAREAATRQAAANAAQAGLSVADSAEVTKLRAQLARLRNELTKARTSP
jgi:RNA polymerase sigma factor (sigma-70 family)